MSHSPPTFTTLPLPIHTEILEHLTGTRYSRGRKREFYAAVKACEALTPLWRELVQEKLWADLWVPIKRLGELRDFYARNPRLGAYLRKLTLSGSGNLDAETWNEVLQLLRHLPSGGRFQEFVLRGIELESAANTEFERIDVVKEFFLDVSEGEGVDIPTLRSVIESIAGKELLSLQVSLNEKWVSQRDVRRGIHHGLGRIMKDLKTTIAQNLTSLHLNYETFIPGDQRETRIFAYAEDTLFSALRVLSKQLVDFSFTGGRYAPQIFMCEHGQQEDEPEWPKLKKYKLEFSPISAEGEWMYSYWGPTQCCFNAPEPAVESLQSPLSCPEEDDELSENDSEDDEEEGPDCDRITTEKDPRNRPLRRFLDPFFICASTAMVPHTPALESWTLKVGPITYLCFERKDLTLTRDVSYLPPPEAVQPWLMRFGGGADGFWRHAHQAKQISVPGIKLVKVGNIFDGGDAWRFLDDEDMEEWRRDMQPVVGKRGGLFRGSPADRARTIIHGTPQPAGGPRPRVLFGES